MCNAPAELKRLQTYWKAQGGVSLGIVGDTRHQGRGVSYHLGKDHLRSDAYSIRTKRDRAGLTNAASAIDLGKLDGSFTKLQKFSIWFAEQCRKYASYNDVREVIFWDPRTDQVMGWSDLSPTRLIPGYGDSSHKTHTHISFYRDSEKRDKVTLFDGYFESKPTPGPKRSLPVKEDMVLSAYLPGHTGVVKKTANVRTEPKLTGTVIRVVTTPEPWVLTGRVKGQVDPEGGSDQWFVRWASGRWEYTAYSNMSALVAPARSAGS